MDRRPPRPATSAEPAHWLTDRVELWGQHWVTSLVGRGFPAYARLLHPLDDQPGWSTWAAVARANGRTVHPSVQWEKIRAPALLTASNTNRGRSQPGDPRWGHLNTWALEELCAILARHTAIPQMCYFGVCGGCGLWRRETPMVAHFAPDGVLPDVQPPAPAPTEWRLDLSGPTFSLPNRSDYYLFEGHVGDAVRIGRWVHESWFVAQSPHFFWPADHSWCVATDITEDSTVIGGSRELVDELCASMALEVLPIAPDAPSNDHLNL